MKLNQNFKHPMEICDGTEPFHHVENRRTMKNTPPETNVTMDTRPFEDVFPTF